MAWTFTCSGRLQILLISSSSKAPTQQDPNPSEWAVKSMFSAAAAENMLLTAHSLGLGSCWVGAFDEEEIRRICNLPEHVNVQGIITIGYADENPQAPPKYRIEHVMFFEKWWGRIEGPKTGLGN